MNETTQVGSTAGVRNYRDRIADTWDDADPLVLAFGGEGLPVVAEVDGELRYLSYHVVRPRRVNDGDLAKFIALRGDPHVLPLSEHPAGYTPRLLRMRAV